MIKLRVKVQRVRNFFTQKLHNVDLGLLNGMFHYFRILATFCATKIIDGTAPICSVCDKLLVCLANANTTYMYA